MSQVHPQARTTPRTRAEIKASAAPVTELAERYNITVATARKWKSRETPEDLSHRPRKLSTTLSPSQEAIVVELRRMLLLPLDDLLVVTREFINAQVSRSGLDRCLQRHGVGKGRGHLIAVLGHMSHLARGQPQLDHQGQYKSGREGQGDIVGLHRARV